MRRTILLVLMIPAIVSAQGDDSPWYAQILKQENPDNLAYASHVDKECPFSLEETETLVEGVFVRSRLKPIGSYGEFKV